MRAFVLRQKLWLGRALAAVAGVCRHHYFSIISGGILAAALVVAMTDGSFGDGAVNEGSRPQTRADAPPQGLQPPDPPAAKPPARERWIHYYLVDSVEMAHVYEQAIHSDATYRAEQGLDPGPETYIYFFLMDTPENEAMAARYINQVAESAPSQGYSLRVIDLRD